jgi:hypothetical protein
MLLEAPSMILGKCVRLQVRLALAAIAPLRTLREMRTIKHRNSLGNFAPAGSCSRGFLSSTRIVVRSTFKKRGCAERDLNVPRSSRFQEPGEGSAV